jgi:hypothetical protein
MKQTFFRIASYAAIAMASVAAARTAKGATVQYAASAHNICTAGSILSEFTGFGSISLNLSTIARSLVSANNGGGNTSAAETTHAGGVAAVTCEFTPTAPIPEPSSLAAAILGSFGLIVWRWRTKGRRG